MIAISGWRRLLWFTDFVHCLLAEGKYPNLKHDGDKLIQGLKDENVHDASISELTQKRYLALGKRVQLHKKMLMRWEMFHQRDALIDQLSTLRFVFSISEREDDIAFILNELFMQQRAGLRNCLTMPKSKNEACFSFFLFICLFISCFSFLGLLCSSIFSCLFLLSFL